MMTYQASREDAPGLQEAGETSLAAGTSAVEVTHTHRALVLSIAALFAIGLSIAAVARTSGAVRGFTAVFGFLAKRFFRWEQPR